VARVLLLLGVMSSSRVAAAIVLFNLVDALFTLVYLQAGVAREANPLMTTAFGGGAVGFMVIKLALVSLSVGLLFRLRHRRSAASALVVTAVAYASLVAYHLSEVPRLVG
jgi:hypothetical protein